MTITGKFTSIPSGTKTAVLTGKRLHYPFDMMAQFTASSSDCSDGEYRQYVRGVFKSNGQVVTHYLCQLTGRKLSATNYQLDGCSPPGCSAYGFRSCPPDPVDEYTPTQAKGCTYTGFDDPGITGSIGDTISMDLDFVGQLVEVSTSKVLATSTWTIEGSAKLMASRLVGTAIDTSSGEQGGPVSVTLTAHPEDEIWDACVALVGQADGPLLDGDDVSIKVTDAAGAELTCVKRHAGPLVQVGDSRKTTANALFQLACGDADPARVQVQLPGRTLSCELEAEDD